MATYAVTTTHFTKFPSLGVPRPAGAPSTPGYVVETTSTKITAPPTTGFAAKDFPFLYAWEAESWRAYGYLTTSGDSSSHVLADLRVSLFVLHV